MVRLSFLIIACFFSPLSGEQIVYMTLAKGGSHLLRKTLSSLLPLPFRQLPSGPVFDQHEASYLSFDKEVILHHHLEPGFTTISADRANVFCKIVLVRDPRDTIISMYEWIHVMTCPSESPHFFSMPKEQQLEELIVCPDLSMNRSFPFVFDTVEGIKTAMQWKANPSVLFCFFEDLVGPLGGGSQERQKKTLKAIANHLHLSLTEIEIEKIANSLFGNTCTFRQGKIGEWKKHFTERHKELIKDYLGNELIALGYEQDMNW